MKKAIYILVLSAFVAAPAMAEMYPTYSPTFGPGSGEKSLQTILNDITVVTASNPSGNSSVNTLTDAVREDYDSYWEMTASSGSIATFIIEITANSASLAFGLYDPTNIAEKAMIFAGGDTAGKTAKVEIRAGGWVYVENVLTPVQLSSNLFGFYLGGNVGPWYSDSSLNPNGSDQMLAYQGPNDDYVLLPGAGFAGEWTDNEFVLAWEDVLFASGDGDYNDLVLMIESVKPVPVPAAVLLGMIGMSVAGLKLRKRA